MSTPKVLSITMKDAMRAVGFMRSDSLPGCQLPHLAWVLCLIGLSGCHKPWPILEGTRLSQVLLRYSPDVGHTYHYRVSITVDKEMVVGGKRLKEGKEEGQFDFSMTAFEKSSDGYRTQFEARLSRSNFSKQVADEMRDKLKAAQSKEVMISDRYVWDNGGTQDLCFPEQTVGPGAEWRGVVQFSFGDLATTEKPMLPMTYRIVKAVKSPDGRFAVIECAPQALQKSVFHDHHTIKNAKHLRLHSIDCNVNGSEHA